MFNVVGRFLRWIFGKFATASLIVTLALAAGGLWLFLKDNVDFDLWRQELVRTLNGERAKTQAALGDVQQRLLKISVELASEQERARQTDKVIAQLHDLESTWERLVGNREQQKANAEQLDRMTAVRAASEKKLQALQQEFTHTTWERDGLEIAIGKVETRLKAAEENQSKVLHYLERLWNYPVGRGLLRLPVKIWIYLFVGGYFLGPTVGKVAMYFAIAPWIARGRPVRIEEEMGEWPSVAASAVSAEIVLRTGEKMWVKEKFLQASDEALHKQTRTVLDWRIPFTCLATGLIELIELRHGGGEGEQRLTLSNRTDPYSELSVVTLSKGAALVLRPSFLAGVVIADAAALKLRRRWQLFRWQAWVTLQFRFFEFIGPCQLIIAGSRGVRVEKLGAGDGQSAARRAHQDATIGFTPNLDYRPARVETFWSYYRGASPLFDDVFAGRGLFLCQQISTPGDARKARRFWASLWGGVMKIFGL